MQSTGSEPSRPHPRHHVDDRRIANAPAYRSAGADTHCSLGRSITETSSAPSCTAAKVWLTGYVTGGGLAQELPLTTSFDYEQCGRILYTSYHTLGRGTAPAGAEFPDYCGMRALSPQERVLMYLILHISDCLSVE